MAGKGDGGESIYGPTFEGMYLISHILVDYSNLAGQKSSQLKIVFGVTY